MNRHEKVLDILIKEGLYRLNNEPSLSDIKNFMETYKILYPSRNTALKPKQIIFNAKLAALSMLKVCTVKNRNLKSGFVYIISNPAWKTRYKIGISYEPKERLKKYQTYSPFRDYKLESYHFFLDKKTAESLLHQELGSYYEWVKVTNLESLTEKLSKASDLRKLLDG